MKPLRMTEAAAREAQEAWGFNCGPGALCGLLDVTPAEIRPHLLEFERKRYTNPTLMEDILRRLAVPFRVGYRGDIPHPQPETVLPAFGLVRIQWSGRWTRRGVPMRVRYRRTHWIAVRDCQPGEACGGKMVFDVNGVGEGWITFHVWRTQLVPWLIAGIDPQIEGWWPTHCLEIGRGIRLDDTLALMRSRPALMETVGQILKGEAV